MIPLSKLEDHDEQVSIYGEIGSVDDLAESIREQGVLQNLLVTPMEEGSDELYVIIAGHRRSKAAEQAGLTEVPCTVKLYDTIEDEVVDLIHSNKHRTKTEKQINDEIVALRDALSGDAKERQAAALMRVSDGSDSPLPPIDGNGRTNAQIADKTGRSEKEVERRTIVVDPSYRNKFMQELDSISGTDELKAQCKKQWAGIHRQLDTGELSVSAAAKKVKELQQEFRELCPGYKKPKKVTKKKASAKKVKIKWHILKAEDIVDDEYREHGERDDGVSYGMLGTVPAVKVGASVMVVDWDNLLNLLDPKVKDLKKAA